jgi:hypothetical protein
MINFAVLLEDFTKASINRIGICNIGMMSGNLRASTTGY